MKHEVPGMDHAGRVQRRPAVPWGVGAVRTRALLLVALAASAGGCGPPPKPGELLDAQRLAADPAAAEVRKGAPRLWAEYEKYFREASDRWQDGELAEAKELANVAIILYRTADAAARKGRAEERARVARERLDEALRARDRQRRTLDETEEEIERIRRNIRLARELQQVRKERDQERSEAERALALQKALADARTRHSALLLELKASEAFAAERLAPGPYNKAKNLLDRAAVEIEQGQLALAAASLDSADQAIDEAVAAARPLYEEEQARKKLEEDLRSLVAEASALAGAEVRSEPRGVVVVVSDVFETRRNAQTEIRSDRLPVLDGVARLLAAHTAFPVVVEAHTDDRLKEEQALSISEAQAIVVRNYFVARGLDQARFRTIGYGRQAPVADNRSPEGRSRNRRVEIVFSVRK